MSRTPADPRPRTPSNAGGAGRVERMLAYMSAGIIGLSALAIIAIIVTSLAGVYRSSDQLWAFLTVLPFVGLIAGFALFLAFMIVTILRRRRDAR